MSLLENPYRHAGLPADADIARGGIVTDPSAAEALLARCPVAAPTPLRTLSALAAELDVGSLNVKDESRRMGLGSFKALGAAYAIAREAALLRDAPGSPATREELADALRDRVFACASAGNHALSLAAGARVFGARAVVYLAETVPESFAGRLRELDARVIREGDDYEASMQAARLGAERNGWTLLSDSSWHGYVEMPRRVMEGYLVTASELARQLARPPTHVFLQAGVGGLAAAMAAYFRARWGDDPVIVVVEPEAAPALLESIRAGKPVTASGPASSMARLDCKAPSHLALAALARDADTFMTITEEGCADTVRLLSTHGIDTTPSGAAGVAGLRHLRDGNAHRSALSRDSRVLAFVTEGPEVQS